MSKPSFRRKRDTGRLDAVEDVFGADVDFAQLVELYTSPDEPDTRYSPARCHGTVIRPVAGNRDPKHVSTGYVERQNLNLRMGVRCFTRLTNAFSKRLQNHVHPLAILWPVMSMATRPGFVGRPLVPCGARTQEPCLVHTAHPFPISLGIPTRRRYGIRP